MPFPPEPRGNRFTGHLAPIARDPLARLTTYAREYGDVGTRVTPYPPVTLRPREGLRVRIHRRERSVSASGNASRRG